MRPVLLTLHGLGIRSYGAFVLLGFLAAGSYLWSQRRRLDYSRVDIVDLMLCLVSGALIGAKLGGILLYYRGPWDDPALVLGGGLSFFQGFCGALLGTYLFCRWKAKSFAALLDYGSVAVPLGHAIGRLGCLLNGCCFGHPTGLPWALRITDPLARVPERLRGVPIHPSQLYDSLGNAVIAAALHAALRRGGARGDGRFFAVYLLAYGAWRFLVELTRGNDPGRLSWLLTTPQWFAVGQAALAVILLARVRAGLPAIPAGTR